MTLRHTRSSDRPTADADADTVSMVAVCPLSRLDAMVAGTAASHLVSVINPETLPETPPAIEPANHLKLGLNDISVARDGFILPNSAHIAELIAFVERWDHGGAEGGALLVHCWAGISRSTAAAYIALCVLNPRRETEIAEALRLASPTATPNALMVALADATLQRDGRMIRAVAAIGQGELTMLGQPFALPSRF
jgi:predicted protein tyrosine phosphatase